MGVHVYFESVFFAFAEDFDSVVHEFIVIFTTTFRSQHQQPFAIWFKYTTYGPSCSRASQVTGKRIMLKPHLLSLAKCTSASSRSKGLPIKLFPPFSAVSQNPSSFCEGWSTGALLDPERLTPRNSKVRPVLSTKEDSVVWMNVPLVDLPVAGDMEGTLGINLFVAGWIR